jgi:integration host factor subunit beta
MLKSQLVDRLAEQNRHLYRRDLEKVVDAILDQIAAALARGDRVELRGFGAFSVKSRTARDGRNPPHGRSCRGRPEIISALQDQQANAQAPQWATPIMKAIQ